jgi:hypothetical protein
MKEERKKYEIPSMGRNLVELEDGFCAGSATVQNGSKTQAGIESHSVNTEFGEGGTLDFSTSVNGWD